MTNETLEKSDKNASSRASVVIWEHEHLQKNIRTKIFYKNTSKQEHREADQLI